MKREIKFRAWNGKKMRYKVNISDGKCVRYGYQWFNEGNDVYESTPMQFTGLLDNNGTDSTEVYGGDILYNSDRHEYQEVLYNEERARWDVRYSHGEQRSLAEAIGNLNTVAGNIHENPELLK